MYVMKISFNNQLLSVQHYKHFQNAIADISEENFFTYISIDKAKEVKENLGNPKIFYAGSDSKGIADDFEFRYPNGLNIYIGTILPEDYESNDNDNERSNA